MPGGRPSKYKPEYCDLAYKFCLLGATKDTIGAFFDVATSTVYEWCDNYPEFSEAIKNGSEYADAHVSESLYRKAIGYTLNEEEIKVVPVGNNMGSEIVRVPVKKYYPPDTTSIIFWLKNRQPRLWRDKTEVLNKNLHSEPLSDKRIEEIAAKLNKEV